MSREELFLVSDAGPLQVWLKVMSNLDAGMSSANDSRPSTKTLGVLMHSVFEGRYES